MARSKTKRISKAKGGMMEAEKFYRQYLVGLEIMSKEITRLLDLCKDLYEFLKEKNLSHEFFDWQIKKKRDNG
jgi:hypothetical protein